MRVVGVGSRLTGLRHTLRTGAAPVRRPDVDPVQAAMTDAGLSTMDRIVRVPCLDAVPGLLTTNGILVIHDGESAVVLSPGGSGPRVSFGGAAGEVEHTEHGDSLTDLVTTVLRLRHRVLPGPRPWVSRLRDRRRVAAVGPLTLVSDSPADAAGAVAWHPDEDARLVVLSAWDPAGLGARAREAAAAIDAGGHVPASHGRLTAVVVGRDTAQLRAELDTAIRALPALETTWSTPAGSFCTARPIGGAGRVAFVYPGGFSAYPGAGGDLLRLFPCLHRDFEDETDEPAHRYRLAELYPVTEERERALREDAVSSLTTALNTAVLGTRLLRDVLGLRPEGAIAYSFGELTSLFALGVLDLADWKGRSLAESPVWTEKLSGRRSLAREAWHRPAGEVWATHVVLAGEDVVRKALGGKDKVFVTHVNTQTETVIAGDPDQCAEVLARIGQQSVPSPANHIVHCPLLTEVFDELAELHDHPPRRRPPVELFSAAPAGGSVGRTVATALTEPLDFPRLVESAYRRGFRYFVEVGPAASCTRWIRRILGPREHVAQSIDRRDVPADLTLVRLLARLVSHGVPVDLDGLFSPPPMAIAHRLVRAHRELLGASATVQRETIARLATTHERNGAS